MCRFFILFIGFIIFIGKGGLDAQNIETIKTIPKPGVSGGINIGTQFYSVTGRDARRSPFSYVLAGNVRLKWGLINVPVSFSFRNQQLSYGASFNKFGMSPYYKWVKLHLGHRTMRFSKYSLSGKNFFGAGVELTPGNFRLAAFRGTIRNHLAQRDTLVFGANLIPTYKRRATGVKIGYGNYRNYVDLIYLKVKDDTGDIFEDNPEAIAQLDPAENIVLGTDWKFHILRQLSINGTFNASSYTENTMLKSLSGGDGGINFFRGFTEINPSTKVSIAGETGINLALRGFQLGFKYRRVEPNYRSLGTPFIQADVESYTINTTIGFLKRKVTLSAQGGLERNNLRNLDYLGRKRVIGALRLNILPTENIVANFNYTNYQYETVDGLVQINDTLRYINVNRSFGGNISYRTKGNDFNYGAFLNFNRMVVEDLSPISTINQDITTFNLSVGVNLDWELLDFSAKPSIIYNKFDLTDDEQKNYGFGLKLKKQLLDKNLILSLGNRFTFNDRNDKRDGRVLSTRLGANYKISKRQSFTFNAGILSRSSVVRSNYTELRANLSYGLRF